jgi:predicted transcriptional regulator
MNYNNNNNNLFFSESLKNIFFIFGNEYRLKIIDALFNKKRLTMTKLAVELGAELSTIQNYVEYLLQNEIIEKDQKGNYKLTSLTELLVMQIPSFTFLINNQEYFKEHDFGDLPIHFINRISDLCNSSIIRGYPLIHEKICDIYENCTEYIFNIIHEVDYSKDILDVLESKLKKHDKFVTKTIFSQYPVIPKKYEKIIKNYNFSIFKLNNQIQQKSIEKVKVSLILTDKESILMFPRLEKFTADTTAILYSNDKNFHKWSLDYFIETWNIARNFDLNIYVKSLDV